MRKQSDLRAGQRLISKVLRRDPAKMIISGMGSGKTGGTLDAAYELLSGLVVNHVLIIAPRFVAYNTWPDEIAAWGHTRALGYAVAVGTAEERAAAIAARKEITTINFENLPWLAKHIKSIDNWYWDMVIIDESSRLSNGEARVKPKKIKRVASDGTISYKVSRGGHQTRFGIMTTARKRIERVVELTGTPGDITKLWGQAYLLDQGGALGRDKSNYESDYFIKDHNSHSKREKPGAEASVLDRMGDLAITIPQEKLVDEPIFIPVNVRLPKAALEEYKRFKKTLYSQEWSVEAVSKGVLANKLLQAANGSVYLEDRSVHKIHDAKLDALQEIVETAGDENILTFYSFQFDKDAIRSRFPDAVVANEYKGDLVADWNAGKIKHLLAHPASIGHGTNLQYGGHIAVWYGLTFSLELWQQANMRLPRPGQKKQVLIYIISAENTYDVRALEVLGQRGITQDRIINHFLQYK